jgi:hypothetical protein
MNTLTLFALGAAIALVVSTAPPTAYALDLSVLFGGFAFTKVAGPCRLVRDVREDQRRDDRQAGHVPG